MNLLPPSLTHSLLHSLTPFPQMLLLYKPKTCKIFSYKPALLTCRQGQSVTALVNLYIESIYSRFLFLHTGSFVAIQVSFGHVCLWFSILVHLGSDLIAERLEDRNVPRTQGLLPQEDFFLLVHLGVDCVGRGRRVRLCKFRVSFRVSCIWVLIV